MRHLLALTAITALAITALIVSRAQTTQRAEAVSAVSMHIDCDQAAAGIQDTCNLPGGTKSLTVDMLLMNNTASPITIAAIQGGATSQPQNVLNPLSPPQFDEGGVGSAGSWNCTLFTPKTDDNPDPSIASSFLGCFSGGGAPTVISGGTIRFATQAYSTTAGSGTVLFNRVSVGDKDGIPLMSCNPTIDPGGECFGATVIIAPDPPCEGVCPTPSFTSTPTITPTFTPTRTPCPSACPTPETDFTVEIDCDQARVGTQSRCDLPADTTHLSVDIVFVNGTSSSREITAFALGTRSEPQAVLNPISPPVLDLSGAMSVGSWDCGLHPPAADMNPDPAIADSWLECLKLPGPNPVVAAQSSIRLATISFATTNGSGVVTPFNLVIGDGEVRQIVACPPNRAPSGTCASALLNVGSSGIYPIGITPTPTYTPTHTTTGASPSTSTRTVTPTRTPTSTPTSTATPTPATKLCGAKGSDGKKANRGVRWHRGWGHRPSWACRLD